MICLIQNYKLGQSHPQTDEGLHSSKSTSPIVNLTGRSPREVVANCPFKPRWRVPKANLRHRSCFVSDIHRLLAEERQRPPATQRNSTTALWRLLTLLYLFLVITLSLLYSNYKPNSRLLAIVAFAPDDVGYGRRCLLSDDVLGRIGGGREACGIGEERQGGRLGWKMALREDTGI